MEVHFGASSHATNHIIDVPQVLLWLSSNEELIPLYKGGNVWHWRYRFCVRVSMSHGSQEAHSPGWNCPRLPSKEKKNTKSLAVDFSYSGGRFFPLRSSCLYLSFFFFACNVKNLWIVKSIAKSPTITEEGAGASPSAPTPSPSPLPTARM